MKLIEVEQKCLDENIELINRKVKRNSECIEEHSNEDVNIYSKNDEIDYRIALQENKNLIEIKKNAYFGKLDIKYDGEDEHIPIYIGKKQFIDNGDIIIASWASPIADIFNMYSLGKFNYLSNEENKKIEIKGSVLEKKRISLKEEKVIDVIAIQGKNSSKEEEEFIVKKIEENTSEKLNSIVETVQRDQNEIIRLPIEKNVFVQGCAGSGKSSVAFHRLAYLAYRYKLEKEEMLVISPNNIMKNYTACLMMDIGTEFEVVQYTFKELIEEKIKKEMCNEINQKTLKIRTSKRYKEYLNKYIDYLIENYLERIDFKIDNMILIDYEMILDIWVKKLNMYPLNFRINKFKEYFKKVTKVNMEKFIETLNNDYEKKLTEIKEKIKGGYHIAKVSNLLKKELAAKKERIELEYTYTLDSYLGKLKKINGYDSYKDLFKEEIISKLGRNIFKDEEIEKLVRYGERISFDYYDGVGIYYIKMKLGEKQLKYRHGIIDECQDLTYLEISIIDELTNSFTIVGDFNQIICEEKKQLEITDLREIYSKYTYFKEYNLNKSFRNSKSITEYANEILQPYFISKESIPIAFNRDTKKPKVKQLEKNEDQNVEIGKILEKTKYKNIGILTSNINQAEKVYRSLKEKEKEKVTLIKDETMNYKAGINIMPVNLSKGLEFDHVIITDGEEYKNNMEERRILYIAVTRALHKLDILSSRRDCYIESITKNLYDCEKGLVKSGVSEGLKGTILRFLNDNIGKVSEELIQFIMGKEDVELFKMIATISSIKNLEEFYEEIGFKKENSVQSQEEQKLEAKEIEEVDNNKKDLEKSEMNGFEKRVKERIDIKRRMLVGKQLVVAEYIYNNFGEISKYRSINELAKNLNVSVTTITNLLIRLNLGSYQEFLKKIMINEYLRI